MSVGDELQAKIAELRAAITPSIAGKPHLESWCTESCLARYLRARNLDVYKAEKLLRGTLEWRHIYKPQEIKWEDVRNEAKTGKTFILQSTDKEGRVVVVLRPRNENTKDAEGQIRFLVFNLELASRRADESGVDKITWLIDFDGYSMRNAPPMKTTRQTLSILQNHYPERLGLAICFHPPKLFQFTWQVISPFIDPVTYRKTVFVNGEKGNAIMAEKFNLDSLEKCLGGTAADFTFAEYEQEMALSKN